MDECCDKKGSELLQLKTSHGYVLKIVLAINFAMFFIEMSAGIAARSSSLMADSLDMLGDAVVYAFSLFVLHRGLRWQAGAAILKGTIMLAFGLGVLAEAFTKIAVGTIPVHETMSWIGGLALAANLGCMLLLLRHRNDDINMQSTWLCSRNDIIANFGVILASVAVRATNSFWPDVAVGLIIAGLFLLSSGQTLKSAIAAFRSAPAQGSSVAEPNPVAGSR